MNQPSEHQILIVDDHPVVRNGFKQLISDVADLAVCGETGRASQVQGLVEELGPDLVLLDLSLEGMSGIELTKQLQAHHADLPVLIVSMHNERLYAERALRAGARGYVMKRAPDEQLLQAIRRVLAGRICVSEDIRAKLFPLEAGTAAQKPSPVERLSDRELEVFLLLGKGYAPRHIADELHVSVKTVETHRRRLKQKLNIESAAMLTRYAVQWYKNHEVS